MSPTRVLILSFLIIVASNSLRAAPSEKYDRLYRESPDFKAVEDSLNEVWKKLRPEMGKSEWKKLLDDQRFWLKTQERLLSEAKDDEVGSYLRETCDRALRLRDYYRSLSKKEPIAGEFAKGPDSVAAWRTSIKIGDTECSRLYSLNPSGKFENLTEEGRELARKGKAVVSIDFYKGSASLTKSDLFKKRDEPASRDGERPKTEPAVFSQEGAEAPVENRDAATIASVEKNNESRKGEGIPPAKNSDEAKDSVGAQEARPEIGRAPSSPSGAMDRLGEKPGKPDRTQKIPKEDASRILEGFSLRAKRNGDYVEYYVSSKDPCLIESYAIDEGAVRSSEERANRVYKPRKTRPGKPLYLFSLPAGEKISRVDIITEAGDKSWIFGQK